MNDEELASELEAIESEAEKKGKTRLETEKERLAALLEELETLKTEKEVLEKEKEVKAMIDRLHPSIKHTALEKVKSVLGEAAHDIRGTPEQRSARRARIKKSLGEFREWEKQRMEEKARGEFKPIAGGAAESEESPATQFASYAKKLGGF